MADTQDTGFGRQGGELDLDGGGGGERPLRADQQMGEVDGRVAGHQRVDIVAANAALHLRETGSDLIGFARAQIEHLPKQGFGHAVARPGAEIERRPIGEIALDSGDIIPRRAIAQRARAAGIVADHAADRGARGGGDVDRKPQSVRFERAVEIIQNDPRLDHRALSFDVQLEDAVEMFRAIDDQPGIHRLTALRGAATAHCERDFGGTGGLNSGCDILGCAWHDHACGHDLVDRGIGRIAPARKGIEAGFAPHLAAEAVLNGAVQHGPPIR
ncbi:hypothetical protein ROTO_09160 [Roseovarius tolerans]|uniref:Uncharacterized protein n=1 Tax=Roseovarius tolerans TaxID=74031 RepID=A0A0L6CXZ7_9RHOB|nr:hypothetical protein ROTO_09160 [Roseovarius tolerans]